MKVNNSSTLNTPREKKSRLHRNSRPIIKVWAIILSASPLWLRRPRKRKRTRVSGPRCLEITRKRRKRKRDSLRNRLRTRLSLRDNITLQWQRSIIQASPICSTKSIARLIMSRGLGWPRSQMLQGTTCSLMMSDSSQ
jgi:hypothetical protein